MTDPPLPAPAGSPLADAVAAVAAAAAAAAAVPGVGAVARWELACGGDVRAAAGPGLVTGRYAVDGGSLRLVTSARPGPPGVLPGPDAYQAACIEAYQASQVARGFSPLTIGNGAGTLERFLAACGRRPGR